MLRGAVLVAALLAVPTAAMAQPSAAPVPRKHDPDVALGLSLGGALVGTGLYYLGLKNDHVPTAVTGAGAILLGPSLGHWYSGHVFTRGLGLRAGGFLVMGAGLAVMTSECGIDEDPCNGTLGGLALIGVGTALWGAGTFDDVWTAPGEARRRNRAAAEGLAIAPVITPQHAGLSVAGRF